MRADRQMDVHGHVDAVLSLPIGGEVKIAFQNVKPKFAWAPFSRRI